MVVGNCHSRGLLLIWIIVELGPTVLSVDVDGGCFDVIFKSIISHFSLSHEDDPRKAAILSQRAIKPQTTS